MQRCNLSEIRGIDVLFHEADLQGANLSASNWVGSHFYRANLREITARSAFFTAIHGYGSQWNYADLTASDFRWAHLRQANFEGAIGLQVKIQPREKSGVAAL
jgi:uncharacterized protein YjbI with pentapeptide repeats